MLSFIDCHNIPSMAMCALTNFQFSMIRSIYQLFLQDTVSRTDNFNGSFPSQPHSPAQILDLVRGTQERVSPHPILSIRDSPPTIRSDWNLPFPPWATVDHGLSDAEFNKAMKQLRKEVYNPKYSRQKSLMQNKGSFKGNVNINIIDSKAEEEAVKNEGKSCTICLENFKLNEEVLVTPCNHMFHGDCLVPWVKSHGKCPVCRYVFYENDNNNNDRVIGVSNNNNGRLSRVNNNSNNNGRVSGVSNNNHNNNGRVRVPSNNNGLVNRVTNSSIDLSSYIVAMQEALNWVNRDSLAAQPWTLWTLKARNEDWAVCVALPNNMHDERTLILMSFLRKLFLVVTKLNPTQ